MAGYYLGIDQGTTLTKAVLVDEHWQIVARASKMHRNYYPEPGWVEQDPLEIYENCLAVTAEALRQISGATASDILAMGLNNQGETCCVWDRSSGLPVYNAIVWQDRRTSGMAELWQSQKGERIREICGLVPDAYYSATKLAWILEHVPGARKKFREGKLMMGTLNSYLFWRLTGGECYKTDPSSASCMMLMDLRKTQWSQELLDLLEVSADDLPEICDNTSIFGYTRSENFLGARVPIGGSASDSSASIIGGGCVGKDILKTSYGTGNFMNLQTGGEAVFSGAGLLPVCLWRIGGKPYYALRGACYSAGSAIDWLRDGLRILDRPEDSEQMARSVPDTHDVYFVPALVGLATPFWDPYARGAFLGLTPGVRREHMVRAVLESVVYQVAYCYRIMQNETGTAGGVMRADGGIVKNSFVMQMQADMLGIPVEIPAEKETAAFGSAGMAGVAIGAMSSIEEAGRFVRIRKSFEPRMSADEREERLSRWLDAVNRSLGWAAK